MEGSSGRSGAKGETRAEEFASKCVPQLGDSLTYLDASDTAKRFKAIVGLLSRREGGMDARKSKEKRGTTVTGLRFAAPQIG